MKVATGLRLKRRSIALLAVALAGLLLAGIELWRRQGLYWYDVGRAHSLSISGGHSTLVEVGADGFTFPVSAKHWDTAILGLSVASTISGEWFEPALTLSSKGWLSTQSVERGAAGNRYFTLPRAAIDPGDRVTLDGNHLAWQTQTADLFLFDSAPPPKERILVLAPHPDDAEIAAFGLYSNSNSFIVTITAGDYVDGRYARFHDESEGQRELRGDVRTWDSMTVPLLGGVPAARLANLGFSNSSLTGLARNRASPTSTQTTQFLRYRRGDLLALASNAQRPTWDNLVADLVMLIEGIRPGIIVAPHPAMDAAPDHQQTTKALLQALKLKAEQQPTLYLYTNHHVLSEYYPFGAADSYITAPPWFDTTLAIPALYSHPLSETDQLKKLFALEAMHDLRPAPHRFAGGPTNRFLSRVRHSVAQVIADPLGTYSYFRRAARPNEFFLVYPASDIKALTQHVGLSDASQ